MSALGHVATSPRNVRLPERDIVGDASLSVTLSLRPLAKNIFVKLWRMVSTHEQALAKLDDKNRFWRAPGRVALNSRN